MKNDDYLILTLGSRVRKSPFFEATRRYGARAFTVYNHMYMPVFYEDPETDFWHLVNDVTLWDVACERQVEITGPDAAQFVSILTPRNLSKLQSGQARYVLICDENGGVINDPVLLRLGENHFWLSLADADVLLWAKALAWRTGMDVTIREPDVSPLQLQGPNSKPLMLDLFGDWIEQLKYYNFRQITFQGIPLVVSRTGWSNEVGYELFLRDGQFGDKLWEMIMEAGQKYRIAPGAPSQIRRLEAGLLSYGADMTLENNPYEINLGRLVDLDQDVDFVGKSALRSIKNAGIKQRLVGIEIDGEPITGNENPWLLTRNEQPAGKVTSCVFSPRLKKNIGLAMTPIELTEPGTKLTVHRPEGPVTGTVASVPFYDPKKQIVRQ
jgi:aminomethyltransferase